MRFHGGAGKVVFTMHGVDAAGNRFLLHDVTAYGANCISNGGRA